MAEKIPAYVKQVEQLRKIYLDAELSIYDAIAYKQGRRLVDYGQRAALERVQAILQALIDESWEYVPKIVQGQYLLGKKAELGYANAAQLTITDHSIIEGLVNRLMGELIEANVSTLATLNAAWTHAERVGRLAAPEYRANLLNRLQIGEAAGEHVSTIQAVFMDDLKKNGITAFVDKSGRRWSIATYSEMVIRTSSRQASNMGTLFADADHDLYLMSEHGTTCPICAPLEGRVYSRSGTSTIYPPLAAAFGKVDPNGPDTLDNSWFNIHPNCLHVLTRFYEEGRTPEQLAHIQQVSNFKTNPPTFDPRSKKEMEAYHNKERGRERLLADIRQFEQYKLVLGDDIPKTFATFQRHKRERTDKYDAWQRQYRARNREIKDLKKEL